MTRPSQEFDWTAWYAKIPGIPLDWGTPSQAPKRNAITPPNRPRQRLRLAH